MRAEAGPYTTEFVLKATGGILVCGDPVATFEAITTDSRDIRPGDLFVPLKGANFDGHEFLFPALAAGARGCLTDRDVDRDIHPNLTNYVLIQVQDTLQTLTDLASAHRKYNSLPLIAVTGSSGKTTVKEMIAAVMRRSHRPLVSIGNFNNLIGLPMTVLNIGLGHTAAVVEAGINMVGEMDRLARAALPDVAVITTIGPVHLEGLGSIENVAREKFKLVRGLTSHGTAVVPAGNEYLAPLLKDCPGKLVTFGIEEGDFRAEQVRLGEKTEFEMISPYGSQRIELRIAGRHNVANALAAAAASLAAGAEMDDVAEGLNEFLPPALRMEILPLHEHRTLIRDCYNANPQSMQAALEVLASTGGGETTLAVLADMMELGDRADELHAEVGRQAARLGISRLVFVGNYGSSFCNGFISAGGDAGAVTLCPDKEAAWSLIKPSLEGFGAILVKGSRATKMELISDRILEEN